MNFGVGKKQLAEKLANRPEFALFPRHDRERIASLCLTEFQKTRLARFFEMLLGIMTCSAVLLGLVIGYLQWGFFGALLVMAISVAIVMLVLTLIFQIAWKCWLRAYVKSIHSQQYSTSFGEDY